PLRPGEPLDEAARPSDAAALRRLRTALQRGLREAHGLRLLAGAASAPVRHGIMRWTIRVVPLRCELAGGAVRGPLQWADPRVPDLPLTTSTRRALHAAASEAFEAAPATGYARTRHARGPRDPR
ncbi:MAG TPA: hypothetical protein VFY71_13650, partial [Planctomycetota bacterium]|nr:hypothetical protein [Planctomycetota bacterium]